MTANFTNGDLTGRALICNCVGPQPGMPRCPCQMRGLIQRNGRWIQPEVDLGPVLALPGQNFWRE
jgi:hypothetical protein